MSFADELKKEVPFLRRYARALTGSQGTGDRYAIAALEAIVADPDAAKTASSARGGLFRAFHTIWSSSGAPVPDEDDVDGGPLESKAQWRLRGLAPNTREALLLKTIESFSEEEIAEVMQMPVDEVAELVDRAFNDMSDLVTGDVLIIEDEAIIAMDLEGIVTGMGHSVTSIARTRDGAVRVGTKNPPDLILADIQLADKSSGIDAVNDLLGELGEIPVIFITAFPERLLTGQRPEPAFLISKPYSTEQVRAAVSQAMFFASTQSLREAV